MKYIIDLPDDFSTESCYVCPINKGRDCPLRGTDNYCPIYESVEAIRFSKKAISLVSETNTDGNPLAFYVAEDK